MKKKKILEIPSRMRIDNAANIYPASLSKYYASLYRIYVSLSDFVDPVLLQQALETVTERIPTFRCGLKSGTFWWHLSRLDKTPQLMPLAPLNHLHFRDNHGFLYRVTADGNRIVLDVFHALGDGYGGEVFLMTLTGEYLRMRYGISIDYNWLVLNPSDAPAKEEFEDSFKTIFSGRSGALEKNDDAYHIKGRKLPFGGLRDVRVVVPSETFLPVCKQYGCSATELLTAMMLHALQELHGKDNDRCRSNVLKVSVPINLRAFYPSRTLRNFSSYVNLGVDVRNGYFPLTELATLVKSQKRLALLPDNLEPKIAENVALEENLAVRCLPLFIKRPIIDYINRHHGDRFCSQTFSNLGNISLPATMQPYVTGFEAVLGRQRGNSGAVACVGYGGKLYVHLSRNISNDDFERCFLSQFDALGVSVETSNSILA